MINKKENKAVSIIVGYVIILGIAFILVSSLFLISSDFTSENRKEAIERNLQVMSDEIAYKIDNAAMLAKEGNSTVTYEIEAKYRPFSYIIAIKGNRIEVTNSQIGDVNSIMTKASSNRDILISQNENKKIKVNKNGKISVK